MSLPRFTAEASLYKTSRHFYVAGKCAGLVDDKKVIPQVQLVVFKDCKNLRICIGLDSEQAPSIDLGCAPIDQSDCELTGSTYRIFELSRF